MIQASLRRNDGLPSGRIWLRSVVRTIQRALAEAGYPLGVDGRFGSNTGSVLRTFQLDHGFEATGTVGRQEWADLLEELYTPLTTATQMAPLQTV